MKNFKSALSLLTALIMVFAIMPGAMAKTATIADATVTVFNAEGTSDGILADGKTAEILRDDWYYTHYEGKQVLGKDNTAIASNLDKVAKFTALDSGIVWSWESSVSVKRIDLWIHTEGGIKDYEIQTSDDGINWDNIVQSGSFAAHYDGNMANYDLGMSLASYYPIVLDEVVNTKNIRFVIKSFVDETSTAYIAEARIYDNNMINFGELDLLSTDRAMSPYLWGFVVSGHTGDLQYQSHYSYTFSRDNGRILPAWSSGTSVKYPAQHPEYPKNGIWYVTSFYRSDVKINKLGLDVVGGTIKELEVWALKDGKATASQWPSNGTATTCPLNVEGHKWTKVATIECNLVDGADGKDVLFDLPDAIEANGYLIRATKYDPMGEVKTNESGTEYYSYGTAFDGFYFYSVAENELSSVSKAAANVFDTVTLAENNASLSIGSTFEYGGNTYNVAWESDSEYLDTKTGEIAPHDTDEEITLTAKISAGNYSYIKEQTLTLPAYENSLTQSVFNADGTSTGILADGIEDAGSVLMDSKYFSRGETVDKNGDDPEDTENGYRAKLAKFNAADSGIKFSWPAKTTVRRLDLWMLSYGGVKGYIIEKSDNGKDWSTVKEGEISSFDAERAQDKSIASYFPIVFDSPVTAKNIRFKIKSFRDTEKPFASNENRWSDEYCSRY